MSKSVAINRSSGVLFHISSISGPYGIGDFGYQAREFALALAESGSCLWQILPLGHTSYGNSPYMCVSAFAGNPWLISPDLLCDDALLSKEECRLAIQNSSEAFVDYESVINVKTELLKKAFLRFKPNEEYLNFEKNNESWLDNYALFVALKQHFAGAPWYQWTSDLVRRENSKINEILVLLSDEIEFWKFVQYIFYKQWFELKQYCNGLGIRIIGDLPIYLAHDSAEVWQYQNLFYLNHDGSPQFVAGVPPDYFSSTGQRWGNPIYKWEKMRENGYVWWIERMRQNMFLYDVIRIDHFRGFEAYWEIAANEETAVNGRWVKGPGAHIFNVLNNKLGNLPVIAEDLGVITQEVEQLRDKFGFPGMRILQMAFGTDPKADDYIVHNYIKNCVAYTATHDHNTSVGWFSVNAGDCTTQSEQELIDERKNALEYFKTKNGQINWLMIEALMESNANWVLFPMQDLLGLGTNSRMNLPGRAEGNWEWRIGRNELSPELLLRLKEMNTKYGRSKK